MQKADSIRRMKWAMEDAFLDSVGARTERTSMRWCKDDWEINTQNRERPGGIQTTAVRGWDGWRKSKFIKRKSNKKMRREHRRITSDAVREFYVDRYDEIIESMEEYCFDDFYDPYVSEHPHYFEENYDDVIWDDFYDYDSHDYNSYDYEMEKFYDAQI